MMVGKETGIGLDWIGFPGFFYLGFFFSGGRGGVVEVSGGSLEEIEGTDVRWVTELDLETTFQSG